MSRALVAVLLAPWCMVAFAQSVASNARAWIDRPWEYRYLLYTERRFSWDRAQEDEAVRRLTDKNFGRFGEPIPYYFSPSFVLDGMESGRVAGDLAILRLDINRDRSVVQRGLRGDQLYARLNALRGIVLTPDEKEPEYLVSFGALFMGAPQASDSRYSPAICSTFHGDSEPIDGYGRYKRNFETSPNRGYFGCREWAAQLYDKDRPYIDVTSYEMEPDYEAKPVKGKQPMVRVTYIRPFIGFSRFKDPPKPVIGKHLQQWYCITDCPRGDPPGPIPDIDAWAARSGWGVPRRPKNVREFMDTPPSIDARE